jgi:hypothetical protein
MERKRYPKAKRLMTSARGQMANRDRQFKLIGQVLSPATTKGRHCSLNFLLRTTAGTRPRSLLWMARLNMAESQVRSST